MPKLKGFFRQKLVFFEEFSQNFSDKRGLFIKFLLMKKNLSPCMMISLSMSKNSFYRTYEQNSK